MSRVAISAFRVFGVSLCAGLLSVFISQWTAAAQEPAIATEQAIHWDEADYTSFAGFVKALERKRYVGLMFKRISGDLKHGDLSAIKPLLERYLTGRHASVAGTALTGDARAALLKTVEDDVRSGLTALAKSSALVAPEELRQAIVTTARRITDHILDPSLASTDVTEQVDMDHVGDKAPEPAKKTRAENTGLFRDVVDMVQQPHLQFLVGGDPLTAKARVAAEILKVARADHLLVDTDTARAFADRLIEAEALHPDERGLFLDELETAAGLRPKERAEQAPNSPAVPAEATRDDSSPSREQEEKQKSVPDSADEGREPATDSETEAPPDLDGASGLTAPDENPSPDQKRRAIPVHPAPARPVHVRVPAQPASPDKADFLIVTELGGGIGVPLHKGDLQPVGQKIDLDPGFSARVGLGAAWLNAVGAAHLSLSLVGVLADAKADRLLGVAGPGVLDTTGARTYYGVLPYLAFEWPVAAGVNLRLGAGVGVAHQRIKVVDAGAKIVSAKGASVLAQLGAGARFKVGTCADAGVDLYATYLGRVKGTGIGGAAVSFAPAWDLAVMASFRLALDDGAGRMACDLFRP